MKQIKAWRCRWSRVAWVVLGFGVGGGGPLRAQATEGVTPVAVGVWRVDLDVYARGEDWSLPVWAGGRASAEGWGAVEFSTGLSERVEARLGWQGFRREELDGAVTRGSGDVVLSAKVALAGDEAEGAAWALMPFVKLPTAGARFSDDTVDAGALAIFGRPWGEAGFVNAQLGVEDYGDGGGGRDAGASGAVVVGWCRGRWAPYVEATAAMYPLSGDSDALAVDLGAGLGWAGNEGGSWGLDLAAYGGMTEAATDVQAVLRAWVEL